MKILAVALFSAFLSVHSFAATDPNKVDAIDTAREGNLSQLVLHHFKTNLTAQCDVNNVVKYEITKIASDSAHQEKVPGTPYDYKGTYLVVQKCLFGSTFAGAYSEPVKSSILRGSFHSKYNKKNGPAKMEDLKIEFVKDIDLSLPSN